MKKGILIFSLVLMATLVVFGFNYQNSKTNSQERFNIESKSQMQGKHGGGKDCAAKCNIKNHDKNNDSKVSKEEFTAHYTSEFANHDKNKDGEVSEAECPMFAKFNSDSDDKLTADEYNKGHESLFADLDKNKDGFLDAEEYKSCCPEKDAAKCAGESHKKEECKSESKPACKTENKSAAPKCCGGGK
jgi:hypothetical protein